MLSESCLGKLYRWSFESRIFAFLACIVRAFGRAWESSLLRRILCGPGRIRAWFSESAIGRALDRFCALLLRFIAELGRRLAPAAKSSRLLSALKGSRLLRPEICFGLFACVMFCVPHAAWRNQYALIAAALFFIWTACLASVRRQLRVMPSDFGLPMLLFILACLASLLFTQDPADSVRVLGFFVCAFLLMWCTSALFSDSEKLAVLLRFIYASVIITAVFALIQRAAGVAVNASQTDLLLNSGVPGRVFSTLDNPNNFAEFLVLFTPLCAVLAANAKTFLRRLAMGLGLILPLAALVMTYSRSGWLSAAVTVLLLAYFTNRRLIPWIFVLALVAVPFLPGGVAVRLANMFNTSDSSADYRLRIWQTALAMLSDQNRWLTGIGLGPGTLASQISLFADDYVLSGIVHSQMLYIELIIETGLLGFVSFIWMMASSVFSAAKGMWKERDPLVRGVLAACTASFAGMAVFGVFEYIWFYPRVLFGFFILYGIMKAAAGMCERKREWLISGE